MHLLRMLTVWDTPLSEIEIHPFQKGKGQNSVRKNLSRFGNLVTIMTENIHLDDVQTRYLEIKRSGYSLRCRSIKLFFSGSIPDLSEKNLIPKGPTWYLPHKLIGIGAVPFGQKEWVFMIERRKGSGVPLQALQYLPNMAYQLEMEEIS